MIHVISDGRILRCIDWKDLVRKMYHRTFDDSVHTKTEYMTEVQSRVKSLYQKYIPTKQHKKFCLMLDKIGLITILRCKMCKHFSDGSCEIGKICIPNNVRCIFFKNGDV